MKYEPFLKDMETSTDLDPKSRPKDISAGIMFGCNLVDVEDAVKKPSDNKIAEARKTATVGLI